MIISVWFNNIKKAKTMAIIMGILTAVLVLSAGVVFATKYFKIHSYEHTKATITAYDTRDAENVWTEFTYSIADEQHTMRVKGHSYWMSIDSEIDVIVNPNKHSQAEVLYDNPYVLSLIILLAAGIFCVFFVLYLVNYLVLRKQN